jgi:hypothetical protein
MVKQELLSKIQEKFQHGIRRHEIKESLMNEGYTETEIDAAIRSIQHDAMKQVPGIAKIYHLIDHFESKPNMTTPHMTLVLMGVCIGILLILAISLYFIFDPLGTRADARDAIREADAVKIQKAIKGYYQKYHMYPSSIDALSPGFLSPIPRDPQTGNEYTYSTLDNNTNYQLCVSLELQPAQCLSAVPVSQDIPVIPTDTPVPTFVPQPANGGTKTINAL